MSDLSQAGLVSSGQTMGQHGGVRNAVHQVGCVKAVNLPAAGFTECGSHCQISQGERISSAAAKVSSMVQQLGACLFT